MHQDGGSQGHRTRKVLLLYYPQDTPDLGPTGVLPGSRTGTVRRMWTCWRSPALPARSR